MKRQYSGTAGRIENSQIGVFLCYASEQGSALVDRELYIPQEWAEDRERRREAGIAEAVEFATKPELARRMIGRALDAGATAAWVAADEVYGHDSKLRRFLESRQMAYVLAVASDQRSWRPDLTQHRVDAIAQSLPEQAWRRLSAGFGSKGERLYDWARMRFSEQEISTAQREKRPAKSEQRLYRVTSRFTVCPSHTRCPAAGTVLTMMRVPRAAFPASWRRRRATAGC